MTPRARVRAGSAPRRPNVGALSTFLRSLGVDPSRDPEFAQTAKLAAAFLAEQTAGLRAPVRAIRASRYRGRAGERVRLERIAVYGLCPHHMVPYLGYVSVSFIPRQRICGIGSIARVIGELTQTPRIQEDLTQAIADQIEGALKPAALEITVRARHLCLEMRGKRQRAVFVTQAKR
jgi:GTP cyclohydrolase I